MKHNHPTATQHSKHPTTAPAWTPGPWELDYDKGSSQDILSRKHGGICTVRRAGCHDNATFAANARLIAAAPEMAEALRKLERGIRLWISEGVSDADMQEARAILTRIHGEGGGV